MATALKINSLLWFSDPCISSECLWFCVLFCSPQSLKSPKLRRMLPPCHHHTCPCARGQFLLPEAALLVPSPTSAPHLHAQPLRRHTSYWRRIRKAFPTVACTDCQVQMRERRRCSISSGWYKYLHVMLSEQHFPLFLSISLPVTRNAPSLSCKC